MNVRNKIASFEAHNEEERLRASPPKRSSPLASPVRTSAEKSTTGISTHSAAFTRKSSVSNKLSNGGGTRRSDDQQNSSSSNNNNKDDVNTSTISEDSSVRAPSTTALASQNRIDRLKRSTSNSFAKGGSRSSNSNSNNHTTTSSATNKNTAATSTTTKDTLLMNRYARSSRLLKTPSMLTGTSATTLRAPQPHDSPLPDPAPRPNQTTTTTQKSGCTTSNTNATHQQQQQREPRSSSKTTATVRRQRAMAHHNSKSANLNKVDSKMESSPVSMAQHQDQHQQEDDDDDDELLSLNKQQELMQPELHLLLGDNTTNSDKPLAPRYSNSGSSSTTIPPIRKSRLDKIHKMQNSRRKQNFAVSHSSSINHHQEQQSLSLFSSSSSKSPTHHHHQQQQQHVSAITTNDNNTSSSSPPNHRRDPSAQQQQQHSSPGGSEEAPDDETLTSVRQIMDPPATTLSSSSATTNPFFRMSSPKSSLTTTAEENGVNRPRLWMRPEDDNNNNSTTNNGRGAVMSGNDRNNKNNNRNSNKPSSRLVMAPSSSSEYETDDQGGHSSYGSVMLQEPTKSGISALTPEVGAFFHNHPQHQQHQQQHQQQERKLFSQQNAAPAPPAYPRPSSNSYYGRHNSSRSDLPSRAGDDDDDDHMYNDDDDDYSDTSLSYEQRRRRQQEEREREARKKAVAAAKAEINKGPFVQQEDVEHYRKTLETPNFQMAAVVATAATIGCVVLGPVGLVVGLSVGALSVGAMQIPAEQRENMLKSAQESCVTASDTISNTCVNTYKDSGISDHVPVDVENCCTGLEGEHKDSMSVLSKELQEEKKDGDRVVDPMATIGPKAVETSRNPPSPTGLARLRNKKGKVACLREGHIIPVEQIHALNPSEQPRAWLDVLASVNTTHNEKVEAMEEILILAKDKQRARIFVEEGILDSIMWTLGRYFEKQKAADTSTNVSWANKDITKEEEDFAKLAAICCLTLGKAYCAAIHTEGDLQLMSLYERGSVPEERQLAQMLHEVPHHTRITKLEDPTIVDPRKEVFTLHQFPLQQAEEVAAAIKALAESGR